MYVDFAVVLLLLVAIAVDILSDYQRMTVVFYMGLLHVLYIIVLV